MTSIVLVSYKDYRAYFVEGMRNIYPVKKSDLILYTLAPIVTASFCEAMVELAVATKDIVESGK